VSDPSLLEILRGIAPYGGLPEDALAALLKRARLRTFAENECIARRGEPVRDLLLILAGSILCVRAESDSGERAVLHFEAGDSVGETLILRGWDYPYDVLAVSAGTRVLELDGADFARLFAVDAALPRAVVEALTQKIFSMGRRIVSLSLASANTRLARYVLALPRRQRAGMPEVALPLAKKDLAALMAITPEHLSRILRRWHDARLVRMEERALLLSNLPILEAMADLQEDLTTPPVIPSVQRSE
jgi:CRP-like cAMP-binding protein